MTDDALETTTALLAGGLLLGDLARSTAFLALEAGLIAQERLNRLTRPARGEHPPALAWLPRALVLGTVAADLAGGYMALRRRAGWWPDLVGPATWEREHRRGAALARDTATALGGVLIKAGQFASARPDLLPAAYVEALGSLQDRVPPHPWPEIEAAIARELGRSRAAVATIDRAPIAAASLAQVHAARLAGPAGRAVALKVQYPEIRELVAVDLAALEWIVAAVAGLEPDLRLGPILDHLRTTLPLELDFGREARAMTELRAALAHRDDVLIPEVVGELSTDRLLVSELVDGIKITDRPGLEAAGIDPEAVARLLNDVYAEQIFRLGRLHADPHPGNLLVRPGPRLVLLDHGLTVELARSTVEGLAGMVRALAAGDLEALGAALAAAGLRLEGPADVGALLRVAGVLLGGEGANGAADLGRRVGRSVGEVPVELITVGRALGLLDGIARTLAPDLDTISIVARYA